MANRKKWTKKKKKLFLDTLRQTANASLACRACGMGRSQAYDLRKEDEDFAAAWQEARDEAVDILEAEAWRRAFEGCDEPVFYKGDLVGYVRKYSDRLMERLLEANRPDKFKHRTANEHTGTDGGPIQHQHGTLPDDPVRQFFEDLEQEDG